MTANKLRSIASRIEQICIELRKVLTGQTIPCDGCKADAEALRKFAAEISAGERLGSGYRDNEVAVAGEHGAAKAPAWLPNALDGDGSTSKPKRRQERRSHY